LESVHGPAMGYRNTARQAEVIFITFYRARKL
jgi:hypothetical protein